MRSLSACLIALAVLLSIPQGRMNAAQPPDRSDSGRLPYRTLDDRLSPRVYTSLQEWQRRSSYLREHIFASAGLLPLPERTPLRAQVFDERRHSDYSVYKVYFESLPGFFVTGNLYRPAGTGPFPAILSPHGHWSFGRLENTELTSGPGRAITLARQGFVVFTHDMIGYNDSRQLTHEFGAKREYLWGLSLSGLQLWNSLRSVDFLESLPDVDRDRIGATGESGGATQTFLLAAVDDRIKVAAPVNMISLHMQGGCLCENPPGLRLDTNNVELAALIAPRPLLMVAATGDWTNETPGLEYPAMRRIYALAGAERRVHSVQFQAPHNFNRDSREAVYAWMARWLKGAPDDVVIRERAYTPERLPDLLVFHGRALPEGALSPAQITDRWIAAARRDLQRTEPRILQTAFLHALALEKRAPSRHSSPAELSGQSSPASPASPASAPSKVVLLAGAGRELQTALERRGFSVRTVRLTPFDADAAAQISHFATYNRTAASQQVADIVSAIDEAPGAALVADGELGTAALLALAVAPVPRAVVDVSQFDNDDDEAFVERLYIPGIRRAGDFRTALAMTSGAVVIHNTADRFKLEGAGIKTRKLTPDEIAAALDVRH